MAIAELPLHTGYAPRYLFNYMKKLSDVLSEIIIERENTIGFINKLSDVFWFQSFSCLLGFDAHSSGTTTVTLGALKQAINKKNLGVKILGGKGKQSLKTPDEIIKVGDEFNFNSQKIDKLIKTSKLVAKIDNTLIQDNYNLYHHNFILDEKGNWAIIQQGMNQKEKLARRYHWNYTNEDLINKAHKSLMGFKVYNKVLNLTRDKSSLIRKDIVDFIKNKDFKHNINMIKEKHKELLKMPFNINWDLLNGLYERQLNSFEELILQKGVGPKTIRSITFATELIYGNKADYSDPLKFSYAHGGKDGVPFPIQRKVYQNTINYFKSILNEIKSNKINKTKLNQRLNKIYNQRFLFRIY